MTNLVSDTLMMEYETIVDRVGIDASDEVIVSELVRCGDWSDRGARVVVQLARAYGTSILRNAVALADAMGIEDGDSGL